MTTNAEPAHATLGVRAVMLYSVGSIGAGVYSTVPSILLLFFMTESLGLAPGLASLAVLIPKLLIVGVDPALGAWSDRHTSRWGRRRPFLLFGAVLSAFAFIALFSIPPLATPAATAAAVGAGYFLASITYSLFAVPYISMPAEIAIGARQQASLISSRMIFVFAGILIGAALPPLIVEHFGSGPAAYQKMATIIAAISSASMLATAFWTPYGDAAKRTDGARLDIAGALRLLAWRPFSASLLFYAIAMAAFGAAAAAAPYFVVYGLDRSESDISAIFACQIIASMVVMAVWGRAVPALGFSKTLAVAAALASAGYLLFALVVPDASLAMALIAGGIVGVGAGGVQVGAFSLLAGVIGRAGTAYGGRFEGFMTGMWTALEKTALAVGPVITAMILTMGGFTGGGEQEAAPANALFATRWAISLAPAAILALAAVIVLWQSASIDSERGR